MLLTISILLISVIIVLAVALYLIVKSLRKRRHIIEHSDKSETWSCSCKVCNTHVAFDARLPLPKIWYCPACNTKNYTQPKFDAN